MKVLPLSIVSSLFLRSFAANFKNQPKYQVKMKATFNFQIKMDDRQTAVLFGMEECKGVDIELMSNLTKLFSETKVKIIKMLEKGSPKDRTGGESISSEPASSGGKSVD